MTVFDIVLRKTRFDVCIDAVDLTKDVEAVSKKPGRDAKIVLERVLHDHIARRGDIAQVMSLVERKLALKVGTQILDLGIDFRKDDAA